MFVYWGSLFLRHHPRRKEEYPMDFVLNSRFIAGLIIGLLLASVLHKKGMMPGKKAA